MSANVSETPICYRLTPDRQLLDGKSASTCGLIRYAVPGDETSGCVVHNIPPCLLGKQHHTTIGCNGVKRVAFMVTPECGGDFRDQTWEAMTTIRTILRQQNEPMAMTVQTVFVDDAANVPKARKLFEACFGDEMPLTLFVAQPPCDGRALAIEGWAISTRTAKVEHHGPRLLTVTHDGLRWIHASGGSLRLEGRTAYEQTTDAFEGMSAVLGTIAASFQDVVRTWLYQGGITDIGRHQESNRARADFLAGIPFHARRLASDRNGHAIYPVGTGIGTLGQGLITACIALQTDRDDVQLLMLDNPLHKSSFDHLEHCPPKTPESARAMALRIADHVTTWVSGAASVVNPGDVRLGDIEKQTEQALTNIERLIDADNFARFGWSDVGATLDELATVRVYVKHPEDYEKCKAVCERRLGPIPAIYARADVCRPDLLVEIEGVAFSPINPDRPPTGRSRNPHAASPSSP